LTRRLTFALQKGGVGKSTSTAATATILAAAGYRVLAVDMDSQGNLTKMLTQRSIYDFAGSTIIEAIEAGDARPYIAEAAENIDLLPADDRLSMLSRYIYTRKVQNPRLLLKRLLQPIEHDYDFVFVDVGPSLGDALVNAIAYADHIIMPVDCGDLSTDAMVRFTEFVEEFGEEERGAADIIGVLLTMQDGRAKYDRDVIDGVRAVYGDLVFDTVIRRRVGLKSMSAHGVQVSAPAMEDYIAMVDELLQKLKQLEGEA